MTGDAGTLTLVVDGYDWTTAHPTRALRFVIVYEDAAGSNESVRAIRAKLDDREAEILYAELDVLGEDRFEHRMLLWPPRLGEIAIAFRDATVETVPVPPDWAR